MKRILWALTVASVIAAFMVVIAAPAMAKGSSLVQIDPFRTLTIYPPDPIKTDRDAIVRSYPTGPIYPPDPIRALEDHNPNVVSGE